MENGWKVMDTKWPDFKTWKICIRDREDFNKILDWKDEMIDFNVIDIGHSDMVLVFDDEENMEEFLGMVIMNHIHVRSEV